MRHVIKYLLVLAVLMSGFYMARMFRAPPAADVGVDAVTENETASLAGPGEDAEPPVASDQLPVAALADVDKTSGAFADDLADFGGKNPAGRAATESPQRSLGGQPTVRRQGGTQRQRPKSDEELRDGSQRDSDSRPEKTTNRWGSSPDGDSNESDSGDSPNWMGSEAESELGDRDADSEESYGSPDEPRSSATYDAPLPDFANDYQPWLEPLEESTQLDTESDASLDNTDSPSETTTEKKKRMKGQSTRRHRIAEGDTLRQLAERYLGDRDRYLDLYEANNEVLFHPRLLPIGIEIVIPVEPTALAVTEEAEDAADLTAKNDQWGSTDDAQSEEEPTYSTWGEY